MTPLRSVVWVNGGLLVGCLAVVAALPLLVLAWLADRWLWGERRP